MSKLFMMDFPTEKIKLNVCYRNGEILDSIEKEASVKTTIPKVMDVYGPMIFPDSPENRPYTMSSIVLSSDGKMAFGDMPAGPVIAKNNFLDPYGAMADFWVLNFLRACSDGVIIGAKTLQVEALNTSHIFDREMAVQRTEILKKRAHPLNIVVSFDATDIPLDHMIFNVDDDQDFQVSIATSPDGGEFLEKNFGRKISFIGPFSADELEKDDFPVDEIRRIVEKPGETIPVFITGEGTSPDSTVLLRLLKKAGIDRLLLESPSYTSHLISKGEMDEFFINYSMVFAGGTITPGSGIPFSFKEHPHARLLTLATHKSSFFYTRQKLYYGIEQAEDLTKYKY